MSAGTTLGGQSSTDFEPAAGDFLPLAVANTTEPQAPALSHWQRVAEQLQRDARAGIALGTIAALLLFATIGPWLWRVDPARQVLDEVSQPPGLGRSALLVKDHRPRSRSGADGTSAQGEPAPLGIAGPATTEGVRLVWPARADARGYAVYRHEYRPRDRDDLGLPLAETAAAARGFEDRLALESRTYYYSVVALHGVDRSGEPATIAVAVRQAIGLGEARRRGLVSGDAEAAGPARELGLAAHPLGTDYLGRDLLARSMHGARTSLFIGLAAPLLQLLIGLVFGGVAGYCGGRVDAIAMRACDFVIALPFLLFMILLEVALGIGPGESGVAPMLVALVLLGWPMPARLVRAEVLRIREQEYVQAARTMGAGAAYLIRRHLLPHGSGVLLVALSFAIPSAIFTEAFLSFIGLGVVPPNPSWGAMCNDGLRTMLAHPHELIVPAAFISVTVLAFNLLGDALAEALNMRTRSL